MVFYECAALHNLDMMELAVIGASLRYTFEEMYRCKNPGRYKTEEEYKQQSMQKKCGYVVKNVKQYKRIDDLNLYYKTCFCHFYTPQIIPLITLATNYEKTGKLSENIIGKDYIMSSKLQQAIGIINSYMQEFKQKMMEDHQRQMELQRK